MATKSDAMFNARPSVTGHFKFASRGTTLPTDASLALDAAFKDGGWAGEDGWTLTEEGSDEKIKVFGGATGRVIRTDYSATLAGSLVEFGNPVTLGLLYGEENVVYTPGVDGAPGKIALTGNPDMTEAMTFVLDLVDGDRHVRLVIPNGQLSRSGDVPFVHTGVVQYGVSIEALPADELDGKPYQIFIDGLAA